ncbi:hypothetical protein [Endozoicomonas sp. 8E]|uniref:hypothetical protein n=1 Tax=Endozoicomonas sp. 8E TaxID=3035692 RepID=UPI0029390F23|nr:hypothetical protein [Endozoicomonas sp. 8E]WOG29055.1 hypothetical protein P6910_05165 [Endozoicomonas sp. 8E]
MANSSKSWRDGLFQAQWQCGDIKKNSLSMDNDMATGGSNLPVNGPGGRQQTVQNQSIPSTQPSKAKMGPRDVSVDETTGSLLQGEAGLHPQYVPIHKRDVVIEKVEGGFWATLLTGFSKLAMRFIRAGIGKTGNKADDKLKSNEQFANENKKKLEGLQHEMKSIQTELKGLRKKLPRLETKKQDQFSKLQKRLFELRAQLSRLERNFHGIKETKPLLKVWDQKIRKETQDFLKLIEKQMGPGLKLIHGLQQVFGKSKKGLPAGKVYHLNLGNLSTTLSSGAELKVQNIGVFIEQCYMSPTKELILDIADIRADLSSMGASGEVEPMTLSGGISIKLKPPTSEYLYKVLTENILKAPIYINAMSKQLKPADVAEVSIKSLQLEKKDGQTLALQDAPFAHSLLDLMIPFMSGSPELPLVALDLEKQWKHKGLEVVCESLDKEEKDRKDDLYQLLEDIKSLPEGEAKDRCQQLSLQATKDLKAIAELREAKIRELTHSKQLRSVQQQRSKNIDSSFDMNRGMIDLVYGLAAVANGSPTGIQKHIAISGMNIPVSGTSSVELSQLKVNVSDFSFSPSGVVELTIPEMASHITLQNEVTGEKKSVPVIVRGAAIKIRPPFGLLVKELLQLKFPVDSKMLDKMVTPIYNETTKKKHSGGTKISDYLEIDLGAVSCLTREGEVAFSGEEASPYEQHRQAFVEKTGDLLSANVDAKAMESALASAGLTKESQQKVWKLCEEGVFADSAVFAPEKLEHLVLPFSGQEPPIPQTSPLPEQEVTHSSEVMTPVPETEPPENTTPNAEISKPEPVLTTSIGTAAENPESPRKVTVDASVAEPERLESILVNPRKNRAVTPSSSSLPEEVKPSEVANAATTRPLSRASVKPATEKSPEGLKFKDLHECIGVINPRFRTEKGKRVADFEMRIAPRGLMKKLSWWMGFFLGKKEVAVEVTLPIDRKSSELQLQSPFVQLKKRTSLNPVVWLATFLVNRRLRQQQYQLELDHVEQQKRLNLAQKSRVRTV